MTDTTPRINRVAGTNPTWTTVVDRDDGRCTCTGACGKSHRNKDTRKSTTHTGQGDTRCTTASAQAPLRIAPRNPATPIALAVRLASTELCTWCDPCLKGATSKAINARNKTRKQALEDANISIW